MAQSSPSIAPRRSTPSPPSFFQRVAVARQRLDILDRTYHRDKDGQFSSGGGGGVREALAAARTVDEVAHVVASQASAIAGDTVRVNLAGADLATARGFGEGVLRGLERHPASPLRDVTTVSAPGNSQLAWNGPANYDVPAVMPNGQRIPSRTITLNTARATDKYFDGVARLAEYRRDGKVAGDRFSTMDSAEAVGLHEFGHTISALGGKRNGKSVYPELEVEAAAKHLASEAGQDVKTFVSQHLSTYAATSLHELGAEAFADHMAHGDDVSPVSKALFDAYDGAAQGWAERVAGTGPSNVDSGLLLDRTYKRDRDGQFSSGDGGDGAVLSTKTVAGDAPTSDTEADLSVIRDADGTTRLHVGIGADGAIEGLSASLDRAGAHQLRDGLTSTAAAGRALHREAKGLQAEADKVDAQRTELYQKTIGEPTEHGNRYKPLSDDDAAELSRLDDKWEALDARIGNLEGGDGETAAHGVVHGSGGDIHYTATVRLPQGATVDVDVSHSGASPDGESRATFTPKGADKLAGHIGEMADQLGVATASATVPAFQALVRAARQRVDVEARVFKRDKDGQFSSGDGGARGIRDTLAAPKTIGELETAAAGEFQRILGQRVGVKLQGLDLEAARAHCEGIARGAEMFPHTDLISVTSYGPGGHRADLGNPNLDTAWGVSESTPGRRGADIALNTRITADKMRDVTRRATEGGLVHGDPHDITRTGSHEFTHAAAASLRRGEAEGMAVQKLRQHGGDDPYGHLFGAISRYAGSNPDELLGEAGAQVATRGQHASPLARDIIATMQGHWEEWEL